MADPQKENGYTPISNEVLEAVAGTKLNGTQLRILLILWRKSYGYRKSECEISLSYLVKSTNSTKSALSREISKLKKMNIIFEIEAPNRRHVKVYKFNKNYDDWKSETLSNQATERCLNRQQNVTQSDNGKVTELGNEGLSNQATEGYPIRQQGVIQSDNGKVTELGNEGLSNQATEGYPIRQQGVIQSDNKGLSNQITNKENINKNINKTFKEKSESAREGKFGNVNLSEKEYAEAVSEMGKDFADQYIDTLSCHMAATGKTYQNHFAIMLKWFNEDKRGGKINPEKKSRYDYEEFERKCFLNLHKDKFTEPEGAED